MTRLLHTLIMACGIKHGVWSKDNFVHTEYVYVYDNSTKVDL